jgi:transcription initiation factor TFIIH subunit 4
MWTFIYFKLQNMTPQNQTAAISMLLMLPYCIVGQSYSSSKLSPPQQDIMELLVLFGALYASSDHRDYFYPTSAAVNMIFKPTITHHTPTSVSSVSAPLTIIVETNFQVIAYISSELHVAMLMLLLDIGTIVRMPNMLLGVITRDSANIAFKKGINANQIVNFLQIHVHSKVLNATRKNATSKKPPVVPENVIDQLHIWEAQKNRINAQEAIFMDLTDFVYVDKLESTYQAFKAHVDSLGMCLYSDPTKHILAVTPEGFRQLQSLANIT